MTKKKKKNTEKYTCAACGGIFEKGWSDEEALKEYEETSFKTKPPVGVHTDLVCDVCYEKLMFWARSKGEV
jgi:DNA-directed RNA polymerase subunit RPC12/RpoP